MRSISHHTTKINVFFIAYASAFNVDDIFLIDKTNFVKFPHTLLQCLYIFLFLICHHSTFFSQFQQLFFLKSRSKMFQDCKDMKSSKRFCFYLFNFCTLIYFGQKFTQNSDFLKFAGQNLDLDKISRIFNKFRNVSLNHSDLTRENVTFTERKMCRKEKSVERRKSACVAFTTRAND